MEAPLLNRIGRIDVEGKAGIPSIQISLDNTFARSGSLNSPRSLLF